MQSFNSDLATRAGLPDEVVHLRTGYPRDAWRFHPNYGGLTRFWLNIHAGLRQEAASLYAALAAAQVDPKAPFDTKFAPALSHFLGHLDMHHRIEGTQFFPKFRLAEPRAMTAIDVLEADHDRIEQALARVEASGRALLATAPGGSDPRRRALDVHAADFDALARMLDRHLTDEEEIVVPAMLVHGERVLS